VFGSTGDPASTVTSMTMVPAFAGLAVIGLAPLWIVLRAYEARISTRQLAPPKGPQMTSVLVTYATRMGSTAEIALVIGEVMTRAGMVVTVCPCHEARDAADYDAVIIGSAVYLRRWDDDAVDYLERQAHSLAERPTWLFQSGPCGEGAQNESIETPRKVAKVIRSHGLKPPVTFGARLIRSAATGPISRWMATGSLAGDFRDRSRIRTWAGERADDRHHATTPPSLAPARSWPCPRVSPTRRPRIVQPPAPH
jgi:menaquinone-dependent protoporphyrinogen oxidase